MHLLAWACFEKNSIPKENNEVFYALDDRSLDAVPQHDSNILPQKDIISPKWLFLLLYQDRKW